MKMSGQQQNYSSQYPPLMVTVKSEANDRSGNETYSNSRTRRHSKDNYRPSSFQARNVYYNSNHRPQVQQQQQQQQYFTRPPATSPRRQQAHYYQSYDRLPSHHHQPIRPLMEIKDNLIAFHDDFDLDSEMIYPDYRQHEPKQRGQYRNRKAELDWDHAFDLDLINLYKTNVDNDNHSMSSTISSSDHSFLSM